MRPRYLCLLASVASITTALGACSSSNGEFVELPGTASSVPSAVGFDQGPAVPARIVDNPGAYKIGHADVLDISIFKVPELARTVEVDESGTITFPPVGEVSVVGKTARDIEHELAKRLEARYLRSPQVTVSVKEFNSQRVTVEGPGASVCGQNHWRMVTLCRWRSRWRKVLARARRRATFPSTSLCAVRPSRTIRCDNLVA